MTRRTPEETVRQMYDAFGAKDEAVLRQLIHADVEWNQCAGFPGGARRRGIEDVLEGVVAGNRARWTGFAAPVDTYVTEGDRVSDREPENGNRRRDGETVHEYRQHIL